MTIKLKFFAILHDLAGVRDADLELPAGATVSVASDAIAKQFPSIAKYLPRIAYAVNQEYQPKETVLRDGDEIALIPPVSGGCALLRADPFANLFNLRKAIAGES